MLARCDHPNIVKFYGAYSISPEIWMVMEYVQGFSFFSFSPFPSLKSIIHFSLKFFFSFLFFSFLFFSFLFFSFLQGLALLM